MTWGEEGSIGGGRWGRQGRERMEDGKVGEAGKDRRVNCRSTKKMERGGDSYPMMGEL